MAFLIDLVPIAALTVIENVLGIAESPLVGLVNFLFLLGYFAGMEYQYGGTLGKRITGLRVALPAGPNVFGNLLLRAFVKIVCLFPPLAVVYGLVAIWRDDGRSLADFVSGSIVVEAYTLTCPPPLTFLGRIGASFVLLASPFAFLLLFAFAVFTGLLSRLFFEILKDAV